MTSAQNISGAMLAMIHSLMTHPLRSRPSRRSLHYPPRFALRGDSRLGAALRAHWTTLRASRFGVIRAWERPCALMAFRRSAPRGARVPFPPTVLPPRSYRDAEADWG